MTFARVPWWFGAIFAAMGLLPLTGGWWLLIAQHYRFATYVPVPAHIIDSRVEAHRTSKGGETYSPEIAYRYAVNGLIHLGHRVTAMGSFSTSGNWAWRICSQYPTGSRATAWYSPQDPDSAFLSREAQFFPHAILLFGSLFASLGAWLLFQSIHGYRLPQPPAQKRDGWFTLHEDGTIRLRFRFYTAITFAWYAYLAVVIGDYFSLNGRQIDLFCLIAGGAGAAIGIVGMVPSWRYNQLSHDFLDAELSIDRQRLQLGDSIQLRLRQGVRRPLQINQLSLGAVCMRSDQVQTGGRVTYTPATEAWGIWHKIEVNRSYAGGGQVSVAGHLTLPHDATPSSPPRTSIYPIFKWFIVLRVTSDGQPELKVHFPVTVEKPLGAALPSAAHAV